MIPPSIRGLWATRFRRAGLAGWTFMVGLPSLLLSAALLAQGQPPKPGLGDIRLQDQFGREHHLSFPRPEPLVLTVADRKGSKEIEDWVRPLKQRFGERLEIHGVADLASVPGFLRGRIQRIFQKEQAHPVMLDWSGTLPRRLGCEKDVANVFVVDRDGSILLRTSGGSTSGRIAEVTGAIDRLIPVRPTASVNPERISGK